MGKITLVFAICFLCACTKDDDPVDTDQINVKLDEFQSIEEWYPYSNLVVEGNVNYYELILEFPAYDEMEHLIFAHSGELCPDAEIVEPCRNAFENLIANSGFLQGCVGICESYYYIRFQENSENLLVVTKEELKQFLGSIDSREDAILWAKVNGYNFQINEVANGGTKKINDGFELLMTQTVHFCLPIQTNRYHLKMKSDGSLSILGEEILLIEEDLCI